MNTLEKLYDISYREKINVSNFKFTNRKAFIVQCDSYLIGIDYSQIKSEKEEKEIMAHELGHYFCNATYYPLASDATIRKNELRAEKWSYSVLVPYNKLKKKIKEGLDIYELSEEFDVDVKYMIDCIDFYVGKYGYFI